MHSVGVAGKIQSDAMYISTLMQKTAVCVFGEMLQNPIDCHHYQP